MCSFMDAGRRLKIMWSEQPYHISRHGCLWFIFDKTEAQRRFLKIYTGVNGKDRIYTLSSSVLCKTARNQQPKP